MCGRAARAALPRISDLDSDFDSLIFLPDAADVSRDAPVRWHRLRRVAATARGPHGTTGVRNRPRTARGPRGARARSGTDRQRGPRIGYGSELHAPRSLGPVRVVTGAERALAAGLFRGPG